jgi:large subunit ribosomal protein L31
MLTFAGSKKNIQPINNNKQMKAGIHPESYRPVAFKDISNGDTFISRSTVATKETAEIDGVTYPLVKLEISSSSHPFYTGKQKLVDTAGRVDKFMTRYAKRMDSKKK